MPNRIKNDPPSKPPSHESKRSHLRLVRRPTHIAGSKKQHSYVVGVFLGIFILTLSSIFFLNHSPSPQNTRMYSSFISLRPTLTEEGIQKFQQTKNQLKDLVKTNLSENRTEIDEVTAQNIAVYLFPELLPDEDFEKVVALQDWKPMQEAIEKNPKSPESRIWFEEMRANIWNYESPDRENPKVSEYAKEVLRLYDELSSP